MNSVTLGSSVSGSCYYTQLGSIVVVTGTLATSAAKADGGNLATGLPGPATSNGILYAKNNNALNSSYAMQINSDGRLNAFGAIPSGVSLRFFSAYIAL